MKRIPLLMGTTVLACLFAAATVNAQEICRTAGFWGTHAGEEKNNSVNITDEVMRAQMSLVDGMDHTGDICVFAFDPILGKDKVTCNFDPPGPAGSLRIVKKPRKMTFPSSICSHPVPTAYPFADRSSLILRQPFRLSV